MKRLVVLGRGMVLLSFAGALTSCSCQLSGTPIDTVTKSANPACWSSYARSNDQAAMPVSSIHDGRESPPSRLSMCRLAAPGTT